MSAPQPMPSETAACSEAPECPAPLGSAVHVFGRDTDGGVAVVFALALVPLVTMVGAAVDYSSLSSRRTMLQSVADAAALNGARALSTSYGQTNTAREQAAITVANEYAN